VTNDSQCYWSEQDGNGTITWSDADLTATGVAQALTANSFWATELANQKIPAPQSYYVSPLRRCLRTAKLTFSNLTLPSAQPFVPTIKELFREAIGVHTCDRRESKTWIAENFPGWPFEHGFTEDDELWRKTERETNEAQDFRSQIVLDDVFANDRNTWLSVTSHSGEIGSLLRGKFFILKT
jgi:broad specificity phosphatase PhoE